MKILTIKFDLEKGHIKSEFNDNIEVNLKDLTVLIGLLETVKSKFTEIYLNETKDKQQ
jgi:hypothetical protein